MTRVLASSRLYRYAAALVVAALALGLRFALDPWLGDSVPFITLFAAVALVVWYAGFGPAVLAALLGGLAANWLFLSPRYVLKFGATPEFALQLVYLFGCALIILLGELARRRALHAEDATRSVRAGESHLQLILDSLPMLVAYIDPDLRYRYNSRSYLRWFGQDPEALRGRSVREVLGDAAFERVRPHMERALAGEIAQFESELPYREGGPRIVSVTYAPHRLDGAVVGFFALVEDVGERRLAERAHAQLAAIVESSEDAIVSKTLDGVVTSWNAGAQRLFGYRAEEMIGQPIRRLIPHDLQREEDDILARLRAGERVANLETERIAKDGRRVFVSLTVSPLRDAQGRLIGASKIARDIGERRAAMQALRESEARFRALADSAPILIWRADVDNRGVWFNRSWLEFTGRSLEEQLGAGWIEPLHPDDREAAVAYCVAHVQRREPFEMEFRMRRHDGAWRWLFDRGVPMFDGPGDAFTGYIGSCIDITERKEAEQRMAEVDRRKDEFLATLAHELRNPLAPILSSAQFLRLKANDPALQRAGDIIERQARHMTRLVDDLFDLSRIRRGSIGLQRESFPLAQAIAAAVETMRPRLDAAGLQLELELQAEPLPVDGDRTRLVQVFCNLLANAIKYTPRDGRISLALRRDGDDALVGVRDTGIGIRADMLDHIFEMFAQADGELEQRQAGLGIGLTLARQLVTMHGGSIEARSDGPGRGSEFVVRLPLAAAVREGAGAAPAPSTDAPGRLRVLVAEDNEDVAQGLVMSLQLGGHEVEAVGDGAAAVAAARARLPHVAVLDIGMPRMNGYDAARGIRALPGGDGVRLIALTGWGQDDDRQRAADAGFDEHFTKPIEYDTLQRAIAAALPR